MMDAVGWMLLEFADACTDDMGSRKYVNNKKIGIINKINIENSEKLNINQLLN